MKVIIHPSQLKGRVHAPPSKSSMQRSLAAAMLCRRPSYLYNPGRSNDDKAAIKIISDLGTSVEWRGDDLCIGTRPGGEVASTIHCGESGLACRMFMPIVALFDKTITVEGSGSLVSRPMNFFDEVFPQLGVTIQSNNGRIPVTIKGPLQPRDITVDGSLSSQFLTGLLMAYAGANARNVSITVNNLASKPYVDLTLEVIRKFDLANIDNRNYGSFIFNEPPPRQKEYHYIVECDWSGAAFLLVAGAIAGPIRVTGLNLTSTQADSAIVDVLMAANAGIAIEAKGINIHPADMKAFEFDATDCPDLFPPLVVLAAHCKGISKIAGVSRLRHKESDRAVALQEEFRKLKIDITIDNDAMAIQGTEKSIGATVSSHHDHRIAMALAVAALKAKGETKIEDAQAIDKSYPSFFEDLKKLGASVSLNHHE